MSKRLLDMSLEELWELFPIFLTEHQSIWDKWYKEEANMLQSILPANQLVRINHIGSTSVDSIWAKPIIDILVEISKEYDIRDIKEILLKQGYLCMSEDDNRISFNKGYTERGFVEKVYHLHLRYIGDNSELYFRDYLIQHPRIAKEYEKLKIALWKKFEHNRDGYTNSKTDFIKKYTAQAKQLYGNRY